VLLRRCHNHGFEDIAQLNIFHNGLRPDTKMILDGAAGGTMMVVDAERATRIIDVLASIDYQAQYNRQSVQKKGVFELNTTDAILAQNKIMTQQMEALTQQMAKLPQQLQAVQASQAVNYQTPLLRCDFCEGNHVNGNCSHKLQWEQQLRKCNIWGILAGRMISRATIKTILLKDGEIHQINHGDGSRRREILVGSLCFNSSSNPHCMIELVSLRKPWRSLCKLL